MEPLEEILKRFRRDFGLEGKLTEEEIRVLAFRHIDPDIIDFVHSVWVEGNILVIRCTEPVVMQEFQARAEGIRLRINRDAGRAALAAVRLQLGSGKKRRS